jgi:D-alanyl-D-alanine carboxypeptidase
MTKLMTIYLIYEAMANQKVDETVTITATDTDEKISQLYEISNNKIKSGVAYPISDLLTAAFVKSSNAAVYMMVKHFYPVSDSAFLDIMNRKAQDFGMVNTVFYNQAGAISRAYDGHYLPERYAMDLNQTTPRDLAILAQHLIVDYPQVIDHTKDYEMTIMKGTKYEEEFQSYNLSLPGGKYELEGVNGLKTGSSPSAQFNSVITGQRGDHTLISVVMGVGDWYDEHSEDYRQIFVNTLMTKGFAIMDGKAKADEKSKGPLHLEVEKTETSQVKWQVKEQNLTKFRGLWWGLAVLGFLGFAYLLGKEWYRSTSY